MELTEDHSHPYGQCLRIVTSARLRRIPLTCLGAFSVTPLHTFLLHGPAFSTIYLHNNLTLGLFHYLRLLSILTITSNDREHAPADPASNPMNANMARTYYSGEVRL